MNTKKTILATLTYFNMFNYPLKKREIYIFLGAKTSRPDFDLALHQLVEEAAVFKIGSFYSLFNNYALAERRLKGNSKAELMIKRAERSAAIIAGFPFVQGVAVSGSLSKKFADEGADTDFFIITAANRLWIARSLLHLFKKLMFLFNLQDHYCMNYFVDEASPCIIEKNIYTATETITLLPICGTPSFELFYQANAWTKDFFPNQYMHISSAKEIKKSWLRCFFEWSTNNAMGDWLDTSLMKLTKKSWDAKKRKKKKNSRGLLMAMHCGKQFSKPDPSNFQKKLLQRYDQNLAEVIGQYESTFEVKNKSL